MKKLVLLLLLIPHVAALNISVVLEDNVTLEGDIVTHQVTAFMDVENVTILDYFQDGVILHGIRLKPGSYGGNELNVARLNIGNLSAYQVANVKYQILEGSGEALLGANTYLIEGGKQQLYPKTVTLGVKKKSPVSKNTSLLFPFAMIILILILMYLKQKRDSMAKF